MSIYIRRKNIMNCIISCFDKESIKSSISPEELQKYKNHLLEKLSLAVNKKIKNVTILKLTEKLSFGNYFASLNNAIFSCEILSCQRIIIDYPNCFINNSIYYKEFNITIEVNKTVNCSEEGVVCAPTGFFLFYRYKNFVPNNRFFVLQNEILNNIPKIKTDINDLYIHIRSGDIFENNINKYYAQPPLCFYEKIINTYKFERIFIISQSKNNPVIDLLLNKYSNIQYVHNDDLRIDISYILNAYNFVTSSSSFATSLINISKNLRILFEYDLIVESEKNLYFHYDYQNYEKHYIRIQMKPTYNYKSKMRPWKATEKQKHLMINETCQTYFKIIF